MPGGGGSSTTTVQQSSLPAWVSDAAQSNYNQATKVAGEKVALPTSYNAPMNSTTKQALSYIQNNLNAGTPAITAAGNTYNTLASPTALTSNIQSLENPYTNDVVNASINDLMDTNKQELMANDDAAAKAGAFGGSRQAITDAVTNAQTAKAAGTLSATLRSQGYDTAAANAIQSLTSAGAGQLNTGQAQSQRVQQNITDLLQGGATQQAQDQADLQSKNQLLTAQQQQDITNLNTRLAALGMSPYPTTTTNTSNTSTSPDYATSGLGVLSLLAGFL